jgi:hypothetical protein
MAACQPIPAISADGAEACPPGTDARLAAIRRLLLDETLAPGDRLAGCLVVLYGQQVSRIAALRTTGTSCADGATRLKLGADWLDVPEPVATLLRQHLRDRSNMTTAANPASPWLFPGQLAGDHRSCRRLVRAFHQLGIPARASRLAAWRELVREAPPAVLAGALGVSAGTAMRHAFLGGADWSAYAARRRAHTPGRQDAVVGHRDGVSPPTVGTAMHYPPERTSGGISSRRRPPRVAHFAAALKVSQRPSTPVGPGPLCWPRLPGSIAAGPRLRR